MADFPIFTKGHSPAVAGWLGTAFIYDSATSLAEPLRFINESINIPQGIEVPTDIHIGQRVPAVFEYRYIAPEGSINFPLICDPSVALVPNALAFDAGMKHVLNAAISPADVNNTNYPPQPPPILGDEITIYRGDATKHIMNPWVDQFSMEGSANNRVTLTLNVKATYGEFSTAVTPPSVGGTVRAVYFNEIGWNNSFMDSLMALTTDGDTTFAPRNFNFELRNNLVPDDSYNDQQLQSLRGFVYGMQEVRCTMTFVGGANPHRGGTEYDITGLPSPLISDLTGSGVNIGDIFIIQDGLWESRTINVPGPTEIAVTSVVLRGMSPKVNSLFCILPGSKIQ